MTYPAAVAAAILLAAASPTFAQVSGGELGIEYNAPLNGSDFGGTTYSGGLGYGVMNLFNLSGNVAAYKFDNIGTDASNLTLHATYLLSPDIMFGGFVASDSIEGEDATLYGVEGRGGLYGATVGGYLGQADDGTDTGTIIGVDAAYPLRAGISAIGNFDYFDAGGDSLNQIAVGAEYQMAVGPQFYAQIGSVTGDFDGQSETAGYLTVGAKVAFGADAGTLFTNRSVLEVLPGF